MSLRGNVPAGNLEADVVIIGGGGAGVPAALTAAEDGAKSVIVLEKRLATGGDALRANWIMAVESRLQKEAGVKLTADDMYKTALEWHRYDRVNPRILHALVYKTSEMIQWLEEKGVEFDLRVSGPATGAADATAHWTKGAGGLCSFGWVFRLLTRKSKEAGVQFLFHTSGKRILRGADGRITGVVAQTRNGPEFEIKAGSVIICTGSFNGSKELLKKYFPYYYSDTCVTDALLNSHTGDGIRMAEEAGADLADFCTLIRHGYSFETTINNRCHEAAQPAGIKVNKLGQRYLAETVRDAMANVLVQQPDKIAYVLYDDKIVQSIVEQGRSPQNPRMPTSPEKVLDFRRYLEKQDKEGVWTKISDNWDEISNWIGCDPKALKATIETYNSFCDHGHDDDFAKDPEYLVPLRTPPYYAIKIEQLRIETIGPVKVNEHMEVLDKQNNPIPGFYSAGVLTSGWESYDYGGTPSGTALSFSMCQGRIAAENAAKYVQGK